MPLSVVYINVDGQPMSEIRGGVVTEYVHDPLGNLIATHTSAGVVTWTGEYWPYGETMISSGTKVNNWDFCAAWGYYDDGYDNSYVRRRVLRRKLARWQTVDPIWPLQSQYGYCWSDPVWFVDPAGQAPCFNVDKDCAKFGPPWSSYPDLATRSCNWLVNCYRDEKCRSRLQKCLKDEGCGEDLLPDMVKKCDGTHCVDIWCVKDGCEGCKPGVYADTKKGTFYYNCGIRLCKFLSTANASWQTAIFIHEISHCSGTKDTKNLPDEKCTAQQIENCVGGILWRPR